MFRRAYRLASKREFKVIDLNYRTFSEAHEWSKRDLFDDLNDAYSYHAQDLIRWYSWCSP